MKWLPNMLTILRCVLAIMVGYSILDFSMDLAGGRPAGPWLFIPFAFFAFTAATDWADGALARALDAESAFGARLDPIADKLLAASALLALSYTERWALFISIPTLLIVGRDVLMTAVREALGNPSNLKVSQAAKWKTAIVLTGIGCILGGMAISEFAHYAERFSPVWLVTRGVLVAGLVMTWIAAVLSVMTGWRYVASLSKSSYQ